jgi:hypothetical protein
MHYTYYVRVSKNVHTDDYDSISTHRLHANNTIFNARR